MTPFTAIVIMLIGCTIGFVTGLVIMKDATKNQAVEGILNVSEDDKGNCRADVVILIPIDDLLSLKKNRIVMEVTHKSS